MNALQTVNKKFKRKKKPYKGVFGIPIYCWVYWQYGWCTQQHPKDYDVRIDFKNCLFNYPFIL